MRAGQTIDEPGYFDRLAAFEAGHWWSRGMGKLAVAWLRPAVRGRTRLVALDLGCGSGLTTARLARRREMGCVIGLDPHGAALDWSRRHHEGPLVRGTALALPFADTSFDVITCFDVFQHLPCGSEPRAAGEIRRVLRPGGVALIRANAVWSRSPLGCQDATPAYRLEQLVGAVGAGGLEVLRASYVNFLPALALELRRLGRRHDPGHGAHDPASGLHRAAGSWTDRLMAGVATAEGFVSSRLRVPFPFGHSTLVLARRAGS